MVTTPLSSTGDDDEAGSMAVLQLSDGDAVAAREDDDDSGSSWRPRSSTPQRHQLLRRAPAPPARAPSPSSSSFSSSFPHFLEDSFSSLCV
ncbi:uncharacterized protein DS421_17g593830 [Arachis hypogaea]|nr:uncharacterized protein DS421_17g593830 [Arachis hypogaea]